MSQFADAVGRGDERDLLVLIDRYAKLRVVAAELRGTVAGDADAAATAAADAVHAQIGMRLGLLQDQADAYRLVSEEVAGKLVGDGWDDGADEPSTVVAWAEHMAAVHPDCTGRFCVAADVELMQTR